MRAWAELYASHQGVRATNLEWTGEIRKKLIALSDGGYCDQSIRGRFSKQSNGDLSEWSIRRNGAQCAEPMTSLVELESAELSILALVHKSGYLHSFTVAVEGKRRDGSTWELAVHLPDDRETPANSGGDRQGLGACSHAALHCHVGPDLNTVPKVRVPLPALNPVQVVEWVISQLVPTGSFEPAPWSAVLDALKTPS